MPFDEETKRGIIDLSFKEHITIGERAKITIAVIKVCDNKKILEYALVSFFALRENPDRYFLIDKIPTTCDSLGTIRSTRMKGIINL